MARFYKKVKQTHGMPSGNMLFVGSKKMDNAELELITYNAQSFERERISALEDLSLHTKTDKMQWLNVNGLHDMKLMSEIQEAFNLHPLLIEDVLNTAQRPKFESFENHLLICVKLLSYNQELSNYESEQVSFIIGKNILVSLQEKKGDIFEPIRERLAINSSRISKSTIDYLAYALLDAITDNHIILIEEMGERIEKFEERIIIKPNHDLLQEMYVYKRELAYLSKFIRPVRDIISHLLKSDSAIIHKNTLQFFKDLQDLVIHSVETLDTYRDLLSDYFNLYLTNNSNRMNEIMKILTIFSTIFIPLTFITGIYGMNFKYFPELNLKIGYPLFWLVSFSIVIVLLIIFKRKKWF